MKKTSSLFPLLVCSVLAVIQLASVPEACAFGGAPGGPYSNGSYFPNEGTFSAVVRGENLSGTLQFSTTSGSGTSGNGSTGVSTVYFEGDTFLGNSQGAYNPQASTMTVNFQADAQGQGQNSISVQTPVTTFGTSTSNGVVTNTSTTTFQTTRQISYFDSLYLNGVANCKTSNAFPNQKFRGSGEAEFQQLVYTGNTPFLEAVNLPISVTGVRLSNTASSFATADVVPPSVTSFSVLVP